ncbi:MAG: hypothetical protein JJ863_21430 [Deltaproteobacteria bacterium]|nr:hypothetical protein [Deltaproteobacteria bacterium]
MARKKREKCPACGRVVKGLPEGRPTDLTPAVALEMARLLSEGWSKVGMCRYVGIPERTFFDWQRRARKGAEPYATLMWGVARAEEEYNHELEMEVRHGTNIAGLPDSAARIALLKSRRDEWTTKVKLEAAREQVLAELLEGLEEQMSPEVFAEHARPALLRLAGVPTEIQALPAAEESGGA